MAAFPGSQDSSNISSPLPVIHEHAAPSFLFPTKGSNDLAHASSVIPNRVPLHLLEQITNGFSKDRLLGAGTYGKVYKGIQKTGETIAVKLFHPMPGLDEKQFELVLHNLSSLNHKNIMRLIGFCLSLEKKFGFCHESQKMIFADKMHRALCFEYMHNGSLDNYLFDEYTGHDWPTRYAIIKGICEGLRYLHEELKPPMYHLYLKPANILLDENMMPKLADFGLSMLFGEEQTRITEICIGTSGYLPPEYIESNIISNKLDIFSLGVIIIKIITGPVGYTQCAEMPSTQFIELVLEKWRKRLQATSLDAMEPYSETIMGCIEMALSCVEEERHKRPCIGDIVDRLNKLEARYQWSSDQFCRDDPRKSIIASKSSITSRPSSVHAEASSSAHMKNCVSAAEPMAMTFQELHRITDGFSENRLLGKGGFGTVYKGVFDNGEVIAVKKLLNKPGLVEEQFKNELLNLVKVKHQNIIRLVGYCSEAKQIIDEHEGKKDLFYREERALCLEYLQGGNLEELLSDESCELDWEERYRIIKGICQGLKHLHTGSEDPIYHLDLKPANILLDSNRIPKIGDFGLSKLLASKETFVTKTYSGTTGYMPPEYMHGRQISSKFDVFSLGVIIIEIIAGPEGYYNYKCLMSAEEFTNHVRENWSKRVQVKTMSTEELLEVERCIKIALRCVEDKQAKRPSITEIVEELNTIS